MEFRLSFLLAFCFIIVNTTLFAQIKAVNDKGEKIILYPDGSWKYDREEDGEENYEEPGQDVGVDIATTLDVAEVRMEIEDDYRNTSLEYETALKDETEQARIMKEYQKEIEIGIKKGTFPKSKAEEKAHYEKLKNFKKLLKSAKQERKTKESLMKKQEKLLRLTPEKLLEGYVSYKSDISEKPSKIKKVKTETNVNPGITQAQETFAKQLEEVKKQNEVEFKSKLEAAKARSTTLLAKQGNDEFMKPDLECGMAFDEVDVFTGDRKRATKRSEFFTFTDPRMESMLRGKDFIKCDGFLSEVGKKKLLVLELQVRSKTARQEYGGIRKGAKIIVKMLDDEMVTLRSTTTDSGKYDIATNTYNFKGVYIIEKNQVKTLSTKEVNVLRIVWESGYEDYEIHEMDFIKNHFTCLKESKSKE